MVVIRRTDSNLKINKDLEDAIENIRIDFKSVIQETPQWPVSIETLIQTKNEESEKLLSIDPDILQLVYNWISENFDSLNYKSVSNIQADHLTEFMSQFEEYLGIR